MIHACHCYLRSNNKKQYINTVRLICQFLNTIITIIYSIYDFKLSHVEISQTQT